MQRIEDWNRLLAELEEEFSTLKELETKNLRAENRLNAGARDELDYAALGYTLHNCYNAIENYCFRIAKFFENDLPDDTWHKELIFRMTLNIKDVRPALFDKETSVLIQELRSFRHVFRNIYQSELDAERIMLLQKKIPRILNSFYNAHKLFIEKLQNLRDQIEKS